MLCAKCTGCGLGCRGTEKLVKAKKMKFATSVEMCMGPAFKAYIEYFETFVWC